MRLVYWLLDLLYPRKCALCRRILSGDETDYCRKCRIETPLFPIREKNTHPSGKRKLRFLDSVTAVWYYKENVREAILRLKFHKALFLAEPLGRSLASRVQQAHPEGLDLLTWVPVSVKRKRQRGYDQSEQLARAVGRELGLPVRPLLKKIRNNPAQSGMSGEERRANVQGVYRAIEGQNTAGLRILLIDDVFTTGATAEECARVLLSAGAKEVHCAVVAAAQKE